MTSHSARRAARALATAGKRTAAATPLVRGADWRTAIVASISSNGTITTTDGIPARRIQPYSYPAVGDRVVISRNGAGNWIALGVLGTGTGAWVTIPAGTGYTALSGYQAPTCRVSGDRVDLRGSYSKPGTGVTIVYGDVFATLPAGYRPAADTDITLVINQGTSGATYGTCRGIVRAATGNIEHRGPNNGSFISIPPMTLWTT